MKRRIISKVLFLLFFTSVCSVNTKAEEAGYIQIWNTVGQAFTELKPGMKNTLTVILGLLTAAVFYGCLIALTEESVLLRVPGCLVILGITVNHTKGFYALAINTVKEVMVVIHTSLPVLTTYTAIAGQNISVITSQAIYLTLLDMTGTIVEKAILPVVSIYFALTAIACVTQAPGLMEITEAIKSLLIFSLRFILTLFIGYTGVIKIFGTIGDSIAKRGIRLAVSSAVPVIGSIAAEAAEGILALASIEKGYAGIAGIISVLTVALLPMLQIGTSYLLFKLFSFFTSALAGKNIGKLVEKIADGYSVLFAITASLLILGLLAILSTFIYASGGV